MSDEERSVQILTPPQLTLRHLELRDACRSYRLSFQDLFPDGVVPTEELVRKHAKDFDWVWAIDYLHAAPAEVRQEALVTWQKMAIKRDEEITKWWRENPTADIMPQDIIAKAHMGHVEATAMLWLKLWQEYPLILGW